MSRNPLHVRQQFAGSALRRACAVACCLVAVAAALTLSPRGGRAAAPASGTVTTANTPANPLRFTAGPFNVPNPTGFAGELQCTAATPCDDYTLNVDVPDGLNDTNEVRVLVQWPNASADFDLRAYVRNADGTAGPEVTGSGTSADPEIMLLPAIKRSYIIRIVPFAPLNQSVSGAVTFEPKASNFTAGTGTAPQYQNYPAQNGLGTSSGEPSIGINWKTGKVMFKAGFQTLRVTFDDTQSPATATWEDKTPPTSIDPAGLDPILFTDPITGRTVASELTGGTSLSSVTDDDGDTWIPEEGGPLTSGVDHQTIGGGPYAPPLTGTAVYPRAVYYCSQDAVTAFCARSDDGGLTYGPTVPMYVLTCGGIHGHVKVAPDGTVYVPHRSCGVNQGVAVSEDNGLTWTARVVADTDPTTSTYDSLPGHWDPSVGIGSNGTVYFGYDHADGTAHVAVSHDRGRTWVNDQNVGKPFNVLDTAFSAVVAGDDDRAAYAFLGSNRPSGDTAAVWRLYVATTYDGGHSWHTVLATPNDPVQIGGICFEGFGVGACPRGDRNLLDFMDVQVDKQGRVLVGYADGCVGCTTESGSRSDLATIARQTCGRRLFQQYDPTSDDCGAQPTPTPTPTPAPVVDSCDGVNVVTDAAGDATNPGPGGQGPTDQADILSVSFSKSGTDIVTKITIKNLGTTPSPGTTFTSYYVAWKGPNGTLYASEADVDATGIVSYGYGPFDGTNQLSTYNSTTGTFTPGANGTITVNVPMSGVGSPTIPITDPAAAAAVNEPYAVTIAGQGAFGAGLVYNAPMDRTNSGPRWAVCPAGTPTPTATPTPTPTPTGDNPACHVPGISVVTDPAGDQTGAPAANQSQDIRDVSIAEQYPGGNAQLVVTMKVAALDPATMTPNASWRTSFNAQHADNSTTTYFVSVANNSAANPAGISYNYGFVDTTGASAISRTVGTADGGSLNATNKTLTVTLSLNKLKKPVAATGGATLSGPVVDLSAGRVLGAVNATTTVLVGAAGNGLNQTLDSTGNGNYTMIGIGTCGTGTSPTPTPTPAPTDPALSPRFQTYAAPNGLGTGAGEPSLGVNWQTGKVMFVANLQTLRITFDDCTSPAKATWEDKSAPNSLRSLDPILFTDHMRAAGDTTPNRTIVSQLTGQDSLAAYTDNDGDSWMPSQGGGIPSGVDHQTVGAGPYSQNVTGVPPQHPLYPNAVYYCSQEAVTAFCARSDDGGLTFGPGIPIYNLTQCGGIHGHVKVAPDGTVYVPDKSCGGKPSVARSTDNGITWAVKSVPDGGTTGFLVDPSVGIGADGTLYLGYQHADGHARIAVSRNRGDSWSPSVDVSGPAGLVNTTFPEVVAGDSDRAAYAFLGTSVAGNYTDPGSYPRSAPWHLYVATTANFGQTWELTDATPTDPVQRGSICNLGTTACQDNQTTYGFNDRNLLDFMDITVDKQGRALVAYPDGCIGGCVNGTTNSYTALASVARQSGGRRLFATYDPTGVTAPGNPLASATADADGVHLTWLVPDNGGAPVTEYRVYRRTSTTARALLARVGTATAFDDQTAQAGTTYYYTVTAVNSAGESQPCATGEITPVIIGATGNACEMPGVSVIKDTADTPPVAPALDIKEVLVAEPYVGDGKDRLAFTIKVGDLTTVTPNAYWYVIWDWGTGPRQFVEAKTDASGVFSFDYGDVGPALPIPPSSVPPTNTNAPNRKGAAQGMVNKLAGTITIVVENSKVGAPAAGQTLTNISPRTFGATGGTNVVSSSALDTTPAASYTLVGSNFCRQQRPPVAVLSAAPTTGTVPLGVNFNATASSDPDAGDSIASYTFNFGDGFITTQTTPMVAHTYTAAGSYRAALIVKDSRGRQSVNVAEVVITVSP
ncbi:MAG TPA: PKD domain-containing protein [Pyrinomonadaceae bacterium]|jgi:hypothetical protein